MIRELCIENFMSIRKEQVLSFEATKDKTSHELLTIEIKPGMRLNRMLILYGANASGKSNILYAYETIWRMLVSPYTKISCRLYLFIRLLWTKIKIPDCPCLFI